MQTSSLFRFVNKISFENVFFYSLSVFWITLSFSKALSNISYGIALGAWLLQINAQKKHFASLSKNILFPFIGYFSICMLSLLWSEYPKESLQGIWKSFKYASIFLMAYTGLKQPEKNRSFVTFFTLWVMVISLDAVYQYLFGHDFIRSIAPQFSRSGYRLSGPFKTYGLLACFLITVIPIFLGTASRLHLRGKLWAQVSLIAFSLLPLGLLYMTRSRGAMLAFGSAISLYLLFRKKWLILLCFMIAGYATVKSLPKTIIFHFDIAHKEQSLVERAYLWDRALQVIQAKPFTGTGINTYTKSHNAYDKRQNWRVKNYYAHNGYLQMAAETGIPSLLCFLTFLLALLKKLFVLKPSSDQHIIPAWGFLIALMAFCLMGTVDTVFHNTNAFVMFWFVAGWSLATLSHTHDLEA